MDQKFPFSSYDFWAYLSAGFFLLFGIDQAFSMGLLMRESWTVTQAVMAFSAAYAGGQLVAGFSSFVFEKLLVGRILGYPRDVLFCEYVAPRWLRSIVPGYFSVLPPPVRTAILEKGVAAGVSSGSDALFWLAFSNIRSVSYVVSRLDNFLNLYGFCRNVACVAFIDALLFYWSYCRGGLSVDLLLWSRLALVAGVGFTLRYLKFYRLYAVEIFTSFAYTKEPEKKP